MEQKITINPEVSMQLMCGKFDENFKIIQDQLAVEIFFTGNDLLIKGNSDSVASTIEILRSMEKLILAGAELDLQKLEYLIYMTLRRDQHQLERLDGEVLLATHKGKLVKPRTKGQSLYCKTIEKNTLTFGVGPAGTGKTFLAVTMAARAFRNKEVSRIIITRPAIEAGEKLGFLPGDLQDKVDPYLRPLYDALGDIFGNETYTRLRERGVIEVAPLAYMRGRTLDNSFIILDEAQNTSKEQMKMFLTRFGSESKVVVNGDITQIDLPTGQVSGLQHAVEILKDVDDIAMVYFGLEDVVRHRLVRKILARYEE
ncbi:MAG: phosphate starvation-inducible protein PhoH [Tissierellia bacterium]|nr:phosphate starvation-inducible protein PhoH [Tissierellia bacterium]